MSRVQTNYSATAGSNVKIGGISLAEGSTYLKNLNNIIRQLMADVKQDSSEIRSLVSVLSSSVHTASSSVADAVSSVGDAVDRAESISSQIANAETNASDALTAAGAAASLAETARSEAAAMAGRIGNVESAVAQISGLSSRLSSVENAVATGQASGSASVTVDGTTVAATGGTLTAVDVAVSGDSADLASARGQIGRTGISSAADLDSMLTDGWYAVSGAVTEGLPGEMLEAIVHVVSGHTTGSIVQTCISYAEAPAVYMRSSSDSGSNWSGWQNVVLVSSVGSGLVYEDGELTVASQLPDVEEGMEAYVLSAGGEWVERVSPEQLQTLQESLDELEAAVTSLQEAYESIDAAGAPPDGETIDVVDGALSVPLYLGATAEEAGEAGLVPPAEAADMDKYLRGDGTWGDMAADVPDYVGPTEETEAVSGLVPPADWADADMFLKADGTWASPTDAVETQVSELNGRLTDLESLGFAEFVEAATLRINALEERIAALEG